LEPHRHWAVRNGIGATPLFPIGGALAEAITGTLTGMIGGTLTETI
jgi:hypothetical protein